VVYILKKIYLRLKKYKFKVIRESLNEVDIDKITKGITKECWNYNIQYRIILKTSNFLIIKLTGQDKVTLLKYHKKEKVILWEYESFLQYLKKYDVNTGIYITTGTFEERINRCKIKVFNIKVYRVDGYKFIRRQNSIGRLSFLEYFPT
jgi:hypothetical protein